MNPFIVTTTRTFVLATLLSLVGSVAQAQPFGTYRWQLQPYCNVLTIAVTQTAGVFTLDGSDDQCGAATRAPVTGLATFNPNGSIEFGLAIVVTPSGTPVHVAAAINLATLGGTWRDSTGATGNLVLTPGAAAAGSPRPHPGASVVPTAFALRSDGGFLAEGTIGQGSIPDSGPGTRLMWYTGKAAFRAGQVTAPAWDDPNVGQHSAAFNLDTVASGARSVAFGHETLASGANTAAFGYQAQAIGAHAMAIGTGTKATGFSSFALGTATTAAGDDSFATGFQNQAAGAHSAVFGAQSQADGFSSFSAGFQTLATGNNSVTLGSYARALAIGSFVFGDTSTTSPVFAPAPHTFTVRADGGTRFFSNAAMTAGVVLANGANAWSALSDVNTKENFRDLDGGDVLAKLARMPIREWNYKSQAAAIRHVGPTAQDFREAFGLGEDPLRISTIDADGIALAGVQALEARTREQHAGLVRDNSDLRQVVEQLRAEIATLRARLDHFDGKR